MNRIRICQLITELRPSGAEMCVYEMARRLDRSRFDVHVAALRGGAVADWLAKEGIPVTVLGVRGKWDVFRLHRLVNLLREKRIDILHTHLFHADLAGRAAASLAAVPHMVHTVHIAEARLRPWQFVFARFFADRCDRIICVSDCVRTHHASHSGLPLWRYQVIENGIDTAAYSHDPQARVRLRKQWGVRDDEPLVAFVGRLDHQKGVDTLLSAMSHLGARGIHRHVVIAGEGPQRYMVENFTRYGEGGKEAIMLGFTRDVRGVYSAADIYVMPSRWEGFGLTAAEAMAAGLPVIATRVLGLKTVVVNGVTGVMIEPNDGIALAEAIETLAKAPELRQRLGRQGLARVQAKYTIAANIAAHEKLYIEVASQKGLYARPAREAAG
jgi:glycosyltransferase involved in cell wall biosynthesis